MTRQGPDDRGEVAPAAVLHREHDTHGDEIHLPGPTIWPVVCAAGITLLAFGVLTHPAFSVVGLLVTARAVGGWIGELCDE